MKILVLDEYMSMGHLGDGAQIQYLNNLPKWREEIESVIEEGYEPDLILMDPKVYDWRPNRHKDFAILIVILLRASFPNVPLIMMTSLPDDVPEKISSRVTVVEKISGTRSLSQIRQAAGIPDPQLTLGL